jgi:hypothetical protein
MDISKELSISYFSSIQELGMPFLKAFTILAIVLAIDWLPYIMKMLSVNNSELITVSVSNRGEI